MKNSLMKSSNCIFFLLRTYFLFLSMYIIFFRYFTTNIFLNLRLHGSKKIRSARSTNISNCWGTQVCFKMKTNRVVARGSNSICWSTIIWKFSVFIGKSVKFAWKWVNQASCHWEKFMHISWEITIA